VFGVTVLGAAIYIIVLAEGAVQGAATIYKRHISTFRFISSILVFLLFRFYKDVASFYERLDAG
jgi:hypothetical protein